MPTLRTLIIVTLTALLAAATTLPLHAATVPLSIAVQGNHLVDGNGNVVQLRGVNVSGGGNCIPIPSQTPGILEPLTQTTAAQTISYIVSWNANAIRVTLNEDCWLGINGVNPQYSGTNYQSTVESFISLAHQNNLYAIVDLHINAPGSYVATSQQVMADNDNALTFWQSVASAFKSDPATIFEVYNEPHITTSNSLDSNTWDCWLNGCTITVTDQNQNNVISGAPDWQSVGMQALVNTVRSTGATNIILCGGLNWSQDLSKWLA